MSTVALAALCSVLLSGCFLQSILGHVGEGGGSTLRATIDVGFCDSESGHPWGLDCTYSIVDDDGVLIGITSSFELISEFGLFGVVIDPLVLQVPATTTNVVATYNDAGSDEPLVITSTESFLAAPGVPVHAEPGTRFLILELPDAVVAALPPTGGTFDFSLGFRVPGPSSWFVKPMFTASVDYQGTRYYPPVFPCVTDFAEIPAVHIPEANFLQDLRPAFAELVANAPDLVCDGTVYDFTAAGGSAGVDVVSLPLARLLDTRAPNSTVDGAGAGGGPVVAGSITEVQVAGRGGVPANADAAVLNVTIVAPAADAFATVFPCGQPVPTASNVNYRAGVDIANTAIVNLDPGGKACIYSFAATHLLADVSAYMPSATRIDTLAPARLLDTRAPNSTVDGAGAGGGPVVAGSITEVQVAGRGGVSANADAAFLNVTVVAPAADAFATVFPCGQPVPTASNVNYRAGVDIANTAIVKLDPGGKACIYTFAATHLLADVNGHIPAVADLDVLTPARLLDTRAPNSTVDGAGAGGGPVAADSVTEVQVAGRGGVPANADTAVLNVTVVAPAADAFATVFPCGQPVPTASNVNYRSGVDIANTAIVKLNAAGKACIYSFTATHLLADVNGHVTD